MPALRSRIKDNRAARTTLFMAQNALVMARSSVAPGVLASPRSAPRFQLAAMIRVKDEARFLPEWLAHHINLGVEHVFVYDNNSTDGTEEVIRPFVQRGLVTHVPWAPIPASPGAECHFLAHSGSSCRWVAFFDADEFLFESHAGELASVLQEHRDRPAVAVCWRYFGSSGHETIPRGLVTERFNHADAVFNRHVKVVARPTEIARARNSHNFYYRRGRLAVTDNGRRVFGSFITPPTRLQLVLHHYVYRSREDYERKARRGYVDGSGHREQSRNLGVVDTEFHRHNDVLVEADPRILQATATTLRELGYPDDLYAPSPSEGSPARQCEPAGPAETVA